MQSLAMPPMPKQPDTIAPAGLTTSALERLWLWPRPAYARYGGALLLVAIAFLLRIAFFGHLDNRLPFSFFLPAAMMAGWYGGLGPGLMAAAIGLLLGDFFFLPPHSAWGPIGDAERTAIGLYSINATLAVILLDNLHDRIRRLDCELRKRDK
jgi:K+-sensing histidine kinase KdpD